MSPRDCRSIRRLLSAFHDKELPVEEHIAVENHLRTCRTCAREARTFGAFGEALRQRASAGKGRSFRDLVSLSSRVVSRYNAEREQSFSRRFERVIEDLHLVWAAVGAASASVVCVAVISSMLVLASQERPDSLAGLLAALASPGTSGSPAWAAGNILAPRADADAVMAAAIVNQGRREDVVFALAAVVTRDGTLSNLELLGSQRGAGQADHKELVDILEAASTARFEPARYAGSPVAVNMVWLLTHTTVRGRPRATSDPGWRHLAPGTSDGQLEKGKTGTNQRDQHSTRIAAPTAIGI
jgi:anti-sigma factor RsiW